MIKIITYDRFKKRQEVEVEDAPEELVRIEDNCEIKFLLQFYDIKRRAVYIEKSRVQLKEGK